MSDRYTRLYTLQKRDYIHDETCPVVCIGGGLLFDNQQNRVLGQLKFKDLSEKTINTVVVKISTYDEDGYQLKSIESFSYDNLYVHENEEFGNNRAILIPDSRTKRFSVQILSVNYIDGEIWRSNASMKMVPLSFENQVMKTVQNDKKHDSTKKVTPLNIALCCVIVVLCGVIAVMAVDKAKIAQPEIVYNEMNDRQGTEETQNSGEITYSETNIEQNEEIQNNSNITNDEQLSDNENHSDNLSNDNAKAEFVPSQDMRVVSAFIYDNDTYIVVENTSDKAIINYTIAYMNFDANGFLTTTDSRTYERGKNSAANLMPGDKTIAGWYGASGKYAVATIASIDFSDGTTWEAEYLDLWAKENKAGFSASEYHDNIQMLAENAQKAENNSYAQLTNFSLTHGNRYASDLDLDFSIKNLSSQGIISVSLFVLEFDQNGFPVSVSPYDTYCKNGHYTGGTINLGIGQSGSYTDDLFIDGSTTQIKIVISSVVLQDGTEWVNPYFYEWMVYHNPKM